VVSGTPELLRPGAVPGFTEVDARGEAAVGSEREGPFVEAVPA
jgi:hypothetical protein